MPYANPESRRPKVREWYLNRSNPSRRNRADGLCRRCDGQRPKYIRSDGRVGECCAECRREWHKRYARKWKYGADYNQGVTACQICERPFAAAGDARPCIDHDHACCSSPKTCGKCIRGVLCRACNKGLGQFRDDPAFLRKAAEYLERRRG